MLTNLNSHHWLGPLVWTLDLKIPPCIYTFSGKSIRCLKSNIYKTASDPAISPKPVLLKSFLGDEHSLAAQAWSQEHFLFYPNRSHLSSFVPPGCISSVSFGFCGGTVGQLVTADLQLPILLLSPAAGGVVMAHQAVRPSDADYEWLRVRSVFLTLARKAVHCQPRALGFLFL